MAYGVSTSGNFDDIESPTCCKSSSITDPYRDTGKTCIGGGVQCPSASSYLMLSFGFRVPEIIKIGLFRLSY